MLVLSRKRDEAILLGDDIKIVVIDIRGDKVRLGIEAPSELPVHRQEVYDAIRRLENDGEKGSAEIHRHVQVLRARVRQDQMCQVL